MWALHIEMYDDRSDKDAVERVLSEHGWKYRAIGAYALVLSSLQQYPIVAIYQTIEALAKIEKNGIYNFQFFQVESVNDATQLLKKRTLDNALQKGLDSPIAPPGTFERIRAKHGIQSKKEETDV